MPKYPATLLSVHDGDTIKAQIYLGCQVSIEQTVRFSGLNAPELPTDAGKVALTFVNDWFTQYCFTGSFLIQTYVSDCKDNYGRLLGTILDPTGIHNLNADLLASGNAVVMKDILQK